MKKILTLICTLLCANVLFAQVGTTFWIDSLQYKVISIIPPSKVVVNDANPLITTANIPSTVNGFSVTAIGNGAFSGCDRLTSVTIPNSVTATGSYAFYGCDSLTSITIPNSVTSIGESAFSYCSSLTSITIPNSVASIRTYAFYGCSSLTSVTLPEYYTEIYYGAFDNVGTRVIIDSVTYSRPYASLMVGGNNFNVGFTTFYVGDNVYRNPVVNASVIDCDTSKSGELVISSIEINDMEYPVTSIGDSAFYSCSSLTSMTIGNSVTSIGYRAFRNCSSLTSVTIGNSVSSIELGTFDSCINLTSVTIGNSVTSIGQSAFSYCSSLTSVTIPNSVTSIGDAAFRNCSSLTSITIPNSVTSIGGAAFLDCSSLTSVTLSNNITELLNYYENGYYYGLFEGCSSLTSVTIPNSVTRIGNSAFRDCSSLTSVTIPNSVTYIGNSAFRDCSSLTSITIPNSVTSIASGVFYNCSSLTSVTIPNSVTYIGNSVFDSCSALTSVSLDMSSIPANLFPQSTALQNLTFGENVTSIASGAFSPYSFLQNVTCLATTPPTLADNTVFPYPNIATLTVPCGTLEAYSSPTSFWNMFFNGRISENEYYYNVVATANDNAFGSVAVESDCSTGTLTATASDCYEFLRWNDGNTENPRTVALTSDTAFTAIFSEVIHNTIINASINPGETYTEYGFNASEAGTYIRSVTTEGCDSIITLILTVNSSLLEAEIEEISFFPNPTKSEITFSQAIEKVEVIALTGKTIFTFSNVKTINIESLPSGAYYLRLTNNDKAIMRKVIKE